MNGGTKRKVSPKEYIKDIYLWIMSFGHSLTEIDNCDFFYLLDLLVYQANKEQEEKIIHPFEKEPIMTIDQVFPGW